MLRISPAPVAGVKAGPPAAPVTAAVPPLLEVGPATLTVEHLQPDLTATLTVGDVVVAEGVPLIATGACP
jgi:hypothetical protein